LSLTRHNHQAQPHLINLSNDFYGQQLLMYNDRVKLIINKLRLKQEIDRSEILNWGIFFFLLLAFFYEAVRESSWFSLILAIFISTGYFYLLARLLKRLYYSFWPFLGFLSLFLILKIFYQPFFSMSFVAYSAALFLLVIQAYSLWTPIFYPIVSWWEYDFRYRDDLKINVLIKDEKSDGRLTDLRRGAGCIASFKDFKLGETLKIEPFDDLESMKFKVEVMSKRKYSVGRPYNYGVRFILDDPSDVSVFSNFVKFWKSERKLKQKKKFKNEPT
jgi:hypothetical protein